MCCRLCSITSSAAWQTFIADSRHRLGMIVDSSLIRLDHSSPVTSGSAKAIADNPSLPMAASQQLDPLLQFVAQIVARELANEDWAVDGRAPKPAFFPLNEDRR